MPLHLDLEPPRNILERMALGKSAQNIKNSIKAAKVKKDKVKVKKEKGAGILAVSAEPQSEEQLRKTEHRRFMYSIKQASPAIKSQYEQLQFKEKEKFRKMWVVDPEWSFTQQFKTRSAAKINQNAAVEASYTSVCFDVRLCMPARFVLFHGCVNSFVQHAMNSQIVIAGILACVI